MFGKLGQIASMMKNLPKLKASMEELQQKLGQITAEGNAGGGMVTVVINGAKQLQSIRIDPEVVSKEDVEMLQDLVVAAVNDAQRKADEALAQQMGGMMGGLKIPGL